MKAKSDVTSRMSQSSCDTFSENEQENLLLLNGKCSHVGPGRLPVRCNHQQITAPEKRNHSWDLRPHGSNFQDCQKEKTMDSNKVLTAFLQQMQHQVSPSELNIIMISMT